MTPAAEVLVLAAVHEARADEAARQRDERRRQRNASEQLGMFDRRVCRCPFCRDWRIDPELARKPHRCLL